VPTDLSVVGFDDLPYAAFFDPALTTVTQPRRRFGELAAEALIKGTQGRRTRLDYALQIRASAAPLTPRKV
jgi:LacI family repressor for deo operon, udp, cdd, tsx, nupC, and nupG